MLPALLKIIKLNEGQKDYPSAWEKNNSDTVFLSKDSHGYSGYVINDIKKGYGIARRASFFSDLFDPEFVASCLRMATMRLGSFFWPWEYDDGNDGAPIRISWC